MFQLLRLPYLALEQLIKSMDFEDQFSLLKLSKRAQRAMRCVLNNRKYKATLRSEASNVELVMEESNKAASHHFALPNSDVDTIKTTIAQLANTFTIEDISFVLFKAHCFVIMDVIPFIKPLGLALGIVRAENDRVQENNKLVEFIFMECTKARELRVRLPTISPFSLKPANYGPFNGDRFIFNRHSWFTMTHLIKWFMNCTHIEIFHPNFTGSGINRFLRAWQKGSKIQEITFFFRVRKFALEDTLNGITAAPVQGVEIDLEGMVRPQRLNGYIIQQDDGRKAFFGLTRGLGGMCVTTTYKLNADEDD